MKLSFTVIFLFEFLILINCQNSCQFSVDQLNNQVLTSIMRKDCKSCFTSDVTLTIEQNTEQITSLKLTAVNDSSPVKEVILEPAVKSLYIDPFFLVQYTHGDNIEATNFMHSCKTQDINGKFVYLLKFSAVIKDDFQYFELNNGYPTSSSNNSLLQKFSLVLILSIILLF